MGTKRSQTVSRTATCVLPSLKHRRRGLERKLAVDSRIAPSSAGPVTSSGRRTGGDEEPHCEECGIAINSVSRRDGSSWCRLWVVRRVLVFLLLAFMLPLRFLSRSLFSARVFLFPSCLRDQRSFAGRTLSVAKFRRSRLPVAAPVLDFPILSRQPSAAHLPASHSVRLMSRFRTSCTWIAQLSKVFTEMAVPSWTSAV